FNPIHIDHHFARTTPFRRPIAHGLLVFAVGSGLGLHAPPMRTQAVVCIREWFFRNPVFPGDTVHVVSRVLAIEPRSPGRRAEVPWGRQVFNHDGKVVMEGTTVTLVQGRASIKAADEGEAATE